MSKEGIQVVYTADRKSVAYCWNKGIRFFLKDKKKNNVMVCNNDVELRPDTYRLLRDLSRSFVTGVSVEDPVQVGTPGDRTLKDLAMSARPHPDYSCFMIARSVIDKGLWFDEEYFPAYCEDMDHHVRMHRAGVNAGCVDMPFLHTRSGTLRTADEAEANYILRGADASRKRFKEIYGCDPNSPEYADLFKPIERPAKVKKEWEPDLIPEV
jgi:hypothetical protein